jgi:hypothetical protein
MINIRSVVTCNTPLSIQSMEVKLYTYLIYATDEDQWLVSLSGWLSTNKRTSLLTGYETVWAWKQAQAGQCRIKLSSHRESNPGVKTTATYFPAHHYSFNKFALQRHRNHKLQHINLFNTFSTTNLDLFTQIYLNVFYDFLYSIVVRKHKQSPSQHL